MPPLFTLVYPHATVGQKQVFLRHPIIHFPTSSGVSKRASKRKSASVCASEASSAEQANE